ncbi:MAG: hypothetical protein JW950_02805 [Deltaproteobacteria bacterium]|nr:hypothetical protein [Deltaproteobacteria bacterium]
MEQLKGVLPEERRDSGSMDDGRASREPAGSNGSWHFKLSFMQDDFGRFPKDFIPPEVRDDNPYRMTKSLNDLLQSPPDWYTTESLEGIFTPMIHFGIEF